MSWTSSKDIRDQVRKLWDSGRILAELAGGEAVFPKRLRLKKPASKEMAQRFGEVRDWIAELENNAGNYRLVHREVRHRLLGKNVLPDEVWVDTMEKALALISRQKEARIFAELVGLTQKQQPQLIAWQVRKPLRALALAEEWPSLLSVVAWLRRHPRPGIYLRQVDIAGIDSKFIENHRGVLAELFDLVLDDEAIDESARGLSGFCRRYGFCDKPVRVRFRLLEEGGGSLVPRATEQDITLTAADFARLDPPVETVFITENEVNFLAFPPFASGMVIFGAGYGFELLARVDWLQRCHLFYWGDIDTHGFAILDQLRTFFPSTVSLLMDRETLLAHRDHWSEEPAPTMAELKRLTMAEGELYDELRFNHLRPRLRLEQERVGYGWLKRALDML